MTTDPDHTPTVIVIGSLNADILLDVDRLPRPGETVAASAFTRAWGGKGANQAVAAAGLGGRTYFVGAVGHDALGEDAVRELTQSGVDVSHVQRAAAPTGTAYVFRELSGENAIVTLAGANAALDAGHVRDVILHLDVARAVVVSNFEIPDEAVLAAADASAARGWSFVLNPGPARKLSSELASRVTVLTPNAEEVSQLGWPTVSALLTAGVDTVVVTRGAEGVDLYLDGTELRLSAFPVEVVDTVGAGDAFTAGLAVGLASGETLQESAVLGAATAAIAVTGMGARGKRITMAAALAIIRAGDRAKSQRLLSPLQRFGNAPSGPNSAHR
jgi:ribokinase